jgi:nitrate reductase cytochrome c-type subunit
MSKIFRSVFGIAAFLSTTAFAAPALKNSFCLDCHGDKTLSMTNATGKEISLFVDKAQLAASAHGTNTCVSCHTDATAKHPDDHKILQPVNCAACHDKPVKLNGANAHAIKKN